MSKSQSEVSLELADLLALAREQIQRDQGIPHDEVCRRARDWRPTGQAQG